MKDVNISSVKRYNIMQSYFKSDKASIYLNDTIIN